MPSEKAAERVARYEAKLDVHGPDPAFNEDGVDLSQIREMLALTPLERLAKLQSWIASFNKIRTARGSR